MQILTAKHYYQAIDEIIDKHIASLVDKTTAQQVFHLTQEQRQRRRELQGIRELRESTKEIWE